ncbi:MAG: hypothetical protein RLZZ511_2609 [Cyanobacteriota bacterium]
MKRRQLITGMAGAIGASTIGLGGCIKIRRAGAEQTSSLPQVRWRMATSWPKSLDTIFGGADTLCKRVAAITDGHTAGYYYIGKHPAFSMSTAMPFGLTAQQQNAWLYQGGGLEALRKIYAEFNLLNFPAGNTGVQMGGWFKRQVQSVADLKGLKMRIPGLGGKVMAQLGVNVQVLPGSEIYLALDRGAIDAAEWVGPYDDEKLGLHKAAKYYYYPGWWEPGPTLEAQVNRGAWDKLPKMYQEAFTTAAYEANLTMLAQYETRNQAALQRLVAGGTQLTAYSPEILGAAQKVAFGLYEDTARENAGFKQVYESWKTYRQQVYQWNKINELSFSGFALNQPLN